MGVEAEKATGVDFAKCTLKKFAKNVCEHRMYESRGR